MRWSRLSASTTSSALDRYADSKNVTADGCQSTYDIDYRSSMLKGIARGWEEGWLRR